MFYISVRQTNERNDQDTEEMTEYLEYKSIRVRIYDTRNTLDCDQSNYSLRIVFSHYLLNLVKPEIAPFDPMTPKTPS